MLHCVNLCYISSKQNTLLNVNFILDCRLQKSYSETLILNEDASDHSFSHQLNMTNECVIKRKLNRLKISCPKKLCRQSGLVSNQTQTRLSSRFFPLQIALLIVKEQALEQYIDLTIRLGIHMSKEKKITTKEEAWLVLYNLILCKKGELKIRCRN